MKAQLVLLVALATLAKSQFPSFSNPLQTAQNVAQKTKDTATGIASNVGAPFQQQFKSFQSTFNKQYSSPEEEKLRLGNFAANSEKIAAFNQDLVGKGLRTFSQAANKFSDLVFDEFNKLYNGFNNALRSKIKVSPPETTFTPSASEAYPESVDWREVGAVSPVRSQEACACCYAFAAAGAIEGHTFKKTGRLTELSPQHLMDCSTAQGNEGCAGGLMEPAYEYVKKGPGINTLDAYPFEAKNGKCRFKRESVGANVTGYAAIPFEDEKALEGAVATMGPVSVAIHVLPSFQFYKEGLYFDPECSSKAEILNHAVLVVGYGKEPNGDKYWLVKNSYGPDWGMGGYIKMAKDKNNHCGIATQATYPLV